MAICHSQGLDSLGLGCSQVVRECGVISRCLLRKWQAYRNGNSQKGYWAVAGSGILTHTITNMRLVAAGYFEILNYYESLHLCD